MGERDRYTVRAKVRYPANREVWHKGPEGDYSQAGLFELDKKAHKLGIGRILLSKKDAKRNPQEIDNPIVDVMNNLGAMNENRGKIIEAGKIALWYQTSEQFSERVVARAESRFKAKHLTPRGQRTQILDMKDRVANRFRLQSDLEAERLSSELYAEDQRLREVAMAELEKDGYLEDMSEEDRNDEFQSVYVDPESMSVNSKKGFKFHRAIHYEGDQVGLRVRQLEEETAALIQSDFDNINEAYREHGLITRDHPELRLDRDLYLFVPLYTASSIMVSEEMYEPYVTAQSVAFQDLGIHKIQ